MAMVLLLPLVVLLWSHTGVSASPPLALTPAFAWSNHRWLARDGSHISYQTLSSDDLAASVRGQEDVDVVMAFLGNKLRSGDVSREGGSSTSDLLQVLSTAVMASNSSVSLPYVAPPKGGMGLMDVLLQSLAGSDLSDDGRVGEVIITGSCVYKGRAGAKRLASLDGLKEYLSVRKGEKPEGKTDLLIVCSNSAVQSAGSKLLSEGEMLDDVLWRLDASNTRYVALYATDLSGGRALPARPVGRQLGSVFVGDEFCNEVCQTKAYLLEGLFVGVTLLIILLSGICCMAGIDSPTRFEHTKDGGQ